MNAVPAMDMSPADLILNKFSESSNKAIREVGSDDLIPLLQLIQAEHGYLPQDVVLEIADRTGIPASRIYGVATFYSQFRLTECGRHTIRCCRGTACHVRGSKDVADALARELNVEEGGTTEDKRFTLEAVACVGTCFLAPVIMIDDDYHGNVSPGRIKKVLKGYK